VSAPIILTDDGSLGANLILAGVTGKTILFLVQPLVGGSQEWFLPGYLRSAGNRLFVIHGTVNEPRKGGKSDWTINLSHVASVLTKVTQ